MKKSVYQSQTLTGLISLIYKTLYDKQSKIKPNYTLACEKELGMEIGEEEI